MHFNKVSYKIFLGMFSLSSMILIIMTVLVKTSYTDSLKRNEINFHVKATSRTKYQFDFILDVINTAAQDMSASPDINTALDAAPQQEVSGFALNSFLRNMQEIQPFLGDITLVGTNGCFYSSNLTLKPEDFKELFAAYVKVFEKGEGRDFYVQLRHGTPNQYKDVLTGVWPIFDTKTQTLKGEIFLGLNYKVFQELFILSPITNNEKSMIVDTKGTIIFHYPAYESFELILREYPELLHANEAIIEGKIARVSSIIVSETSAILGWKFIRIIDAKNVMTDTRKMQVYFNVVFILSVLLSLIFSIYMTRVLTKPLGQLFDGCKRIEQGDMASRVHIRSSDEMGKLGNTFNMMLDQINANFDQERIEQRRKAELRLEVLQAQINPHFLYNTLDSIKFLAQFQEVHNVASMCSLLINLLKYNLSSFALATLREETESLRNYVDLQKYRYGDIFEFTCIIEKDSENCVVSRFILQPLVENSLIHGFNDLESGGEIVVRSFFERDRLCLEVKDNGSGMDKETLEAINHLGILKAKQHHKSIGINNIRERIRLQFGEKATVSYESAEGRGTRVKLYFPIMWPP
ncbi:MAG: histidine kinase [Treponema sp.]|jgi:two-component system sensor histidine kinase YesM|nr:histidine kinase [Treponema sp.]